MEQKKWAYLSIMAGAALWGGIGVFYKQLTAAGLSPMQVVAVRTLTAALFMAVVVLIKDPGLFKIRLRDCGYFIGTGIVSLVFFNWCYFGAIDSSSLSVAVILLYTSPVFVVLMSALLFREKITKQKLTALLITFAGCVLVTGILTGDSARITPVGILLGLGSGFGYALYSIFGQFALRKYHPFTVTLYTFVFAAAASVPLSGLMGQMELVMKPEVLWNGLGIGVVCCVAPFILYTAGLSKVETGKAAIIATVEPAVATVLGITLFQESVTMDKILGLLLIFSAVILLNRPSGKKAIQEQES